MKKILLFLLTGIVLLGCTYKEENKEIETMNITINGTDCIIQLEENDTVKQLLNLRPLTLTMEELNGNEKYVYLNSSLPTHSYNPKKINKGDVMLFRNNCLVIFYKSFNTSYSYTKIGHIDTLPELGNGSITVELDH